MLAQAAGAFWAGAGAGGGGGPAPSGPPTSPDLEFVSGTEEVRVTWVNASGSYYIHVGHSTDEATEPSSALTTLSPGTTTYDTGVEAATLEAVDGDAWWVRHMNGGLVSAWVWAGTSSPDA